MYERDRYNPPRPSPRPRPSLRVVATVSGCVGAIVAVLVFSSLLFDGAIGATTGADEYPHISPPVAVPGPAVPQPVRSCG